MTPIPMNWGLGDEGFGKRRNGLGFGVGPSRHPKIDVGDVENGRTSELMLPPDSVYVAPSPGRR